MRRSRRGGGGGSEFGGSGEDSFVAVVVTKLTGALLFILLLTMVIMALLPKAVDVEVANSGAPASGATQGTPLKITTPPQLPDAIAGGSGPLHWSSSGTLPEWLSLDPDTGRLAGIPPRAINDPLSLAFDVNDGSSSVSQPIMLGVLPAPPSSASAAWVERHLAIIPWNAWLQQGVGFLVLWLVHLLGMNLLANMERGSIEESIVLHENGEAQVEVQKRFSTYRTVIRLATLSAVIGLAGWLYFASAARL
jgi:preprotein translocase subunit SecG